MKREFRQVLRRAFNVVEEAIPWPYQELLITTCLPSKKNINNLLAHKLNISMATHLVMCTFIYQSIRSSIRPANSLFIWLSIRCSREDHKDYNLQSTYVVSVCRKKNNQQNTCALLSVFHLNQTKSNAAISLTQVRLIHFSSFISKIH